MAIVFIPALLRPLTAGATRVPASGATLREVINDLDRQFPGIKSHIADETGPLPEVMLAVGSDEAFGLDHPVGDDTEVHILPAISGG